jgi:hypothetical protein
MVASVAASRSASPRRSTNPTALLRRGFLGAHACAQALLAHGVSTHSRRAYPTVLVTYAAVNLQLREAVEVAMFHATPETLRDAFAAADAVLAEAKRATRSMVAARSLNMAAWSLAMAGLRAGIEELEEGLEAIALLPASAPDYPEED